ncbi:MAG TPA: DUF5615 family PIN-like protein [Pyrinomonadaceae bacterium]|jgi:predicted nuclease of predicted toxin-antitoxin system
MRLLLDECVTRYLKPDLEVGHEVLTIKEAGFKGLENGELLRAAAVSFDVLVTVDKNIQHQQNIANLPIAILILSSLFTRYDSLKPLVPRALEVLKKIRNGEIIVVESDS